MNIEEFINYEAGSGSENDVAYAKELRRAYSYYKDFPRGDVLIDALRDARDALLEFPGLQWQLVDLGQPIC